MTLKKMMDKNFAKCAINDDALWESIRHHREVFTPISGVDYMPDVRKRICLVPPVDVREEWMQDYQSMQSSMIYGDSFSFDELLDRILYQLTKVDTKKIAFFQRSEICVTSLTYSGSLACS